MSDKPVVLIMAGGKGERFWPRSRASCPKQLQKVYSRHTLLEETLKRARTITDNAHIFIGCNATLKKAILRTHKFPAKNFILEPEGRNTAPIIALAALQLEKKFPGHIQAVLSADHFIAPIEDFRKTMLEAIRTAATGRLTTLGVRPNRPETGYGYIHAGQLLASGSARKIRSFKEKPDHKRAMKYIRDKNYYWNSGIFIWKAQTILEEFARHAPEILQPLQEVAGKPALLKKIFPDIPSEPVDIAILEKSDRLAMVPADFRWDDVGSWLSLERILGPDENGNVITAGGAGGRLYARDATGNIIAGASKLVTLLGVKNLILVEEEDILFLSDREHIDSLKEMLADFRSNKTLQKYLR